MDDAGAPDLEHAAAVRLLRVLKDGGYRFVTATPATHRQVLRHPDKQRGRDIRDVLGWSLPFGAEALPADVFAALEAAGALAATDDGFRSTVRVSSLGEDLFLHSAFPPEAKEAIFFGPDTYRFARLLRAALAAQGPVGRLIDIGTGSAAGAVAAARACRAQRITVTDINPRALAVARINIEAAGLQAEAVQGSGLDAVDGQADLIIANPPFIAGDDRTYRDGGDMLGARLSVDWALAGAERLARGGRFILYTGSAIVEGRDGAHDALRERLDGAVFDLSYEELDPDIFGGLIRGPAYAGVERIAAVGAVIMRR